MGDVIYVTYITGIDDSKSFLEPSSVALVKLRAICKINKQKLLKG